MIKSYKDLEVYNRSYKLARDIFHLSAKFPRAEKFSLTSQIVRSSRSVSANISEGWAKREYENMFKQHLIHSMGSAAETQNWLSFAFDCGYISNDEHKRFYDEISKMLTGLHQHWKSK